METELIPNDEGEPNESQAQKRVPGVRHGDVNSRIAQFRKKTEALSKATPEWTIAPEDPLYARPATGGRKVRHHNFNHDVNDAVGEVKYLCQTIQQCGQKNPIDGTSEITLGNYLIKLVGTLIRARKYGYLTFKGELLLQHRDENVIIKLLNQQ